MSDHPKAGDLMEGTGGIRKLRWARGVQDKSGGVRVIYYFHNDAMTLYHLEKKTHMSTAFDSIKHGLLEAIKHAEGRAPQPRTHRPRPVDVKALRAKVSMTQEQFAARFGFYMATSRHWERGDRAQPERGD